MVRLAYAACGRKERYIGLKMSIYEIRIKGQVQGVGFRPFVYRLATELCLTGYVSNTNEGVLITLKSDEQELAFFCERLTNEAPNLAKITAISTQKTNKKTNFSAGFYITKSKNGQKNNVLLSPDFGICSTCKNELHNTKNRRLGYPFITCTYCGPRYSIIKKLPYDREHTSMDVFEMCKKCQNEYENVSDRRYYSQTNSCEKCGIKLSLFNAKNQLIANEKNAIISTTIAALTDGSIVAIKGIGGYLLICDAGNKLTISRLRKKKYRPTKPFAIMFPDLASIQKYAELRLSEKELLSNEVASIVLVSAAMPSLSVAGLVGTMLPYTPLFEIISKQFGKPLIATSGNLSQSPIIYEDQKALDELSSIADYVLTNNRAIVVPQDDSVIRFTPTFNKKIILRRSRGLSPTFILPTFIPQSNVLAMGAMLKSTFTLTHQSNVYVSQYLGDLSDYDTLQSYRHTLSHFSEVLNFEANTILIDKHLAYPSSIIGQELADEKQLELVKIQHHEAHFAAVLAENNLLNSSENILGVIWDGTGLGNDGQIWGGEFFIHNAQSKVRFERVKHFDYFPNLMGDKMAREPRLSALSLCVDIPEAIHLIKSKFSDIEWKIYQKRLGQETLLQTSSVGRLFDGIASLLGISDTTSYEGEAAIDLEAAARSYFLQNNAINEGYFVGNEANTKDLIKGVLADLQINKSMAEIAAKVHFSMIKLIENVAIGLNIKKIAFSGGVWQNALLVDLAIQNLTDFELYFHQQLSPNDECISFGQVVVYELMNRK
jgi:hydrogenase maturation protein HypF